jgi:hypothetical protein
MRSTYSFLSSLMSGDAGHHVVASLILIPARCQWIAEKINAFLMHYGFYLNAADDQGYVYHKHITLSWCVKVTKYPDDSPDQLAVLGAGLVGDILILLESDLAHETEFQWGRSCLPQECKHRRPDVPCQNEQRRTLHPTLRLFARIGEVDTQQSQETPGATRSKHQRGACRPRRRVWAKPSAVVSFAKHLLMQKNGRPAYVQCQQLG